MSIPVIIDTFYDTYLLDMQSNAAPSDISLSANGIVENSIINTVIGTLSTTDSDGGSFIYTLVTGTGDTNNVKFVLSGNQLLSNFVFDFESTSSYSIRVRSTDDGGLYVEKQFTILVANQNEYPLSVSLNTSTISENSTIGSVVGAFTGTDPDVGDVLSYALVSGTGSSGNSYFTISGNQLKTNASLDYETTPSLSINVRCMDLGGLYIDQQFTISVINVNEAPTNIYLSSATVPENSSNGHVVATITTTDSDVGDTFTFSLVSGTGSSGNGYFTIVGNELRVQTNIDYETTPTLSIRIRATDVGGLWTESPFTITVNNVNETPTTITLSTNTLFENTAIGAVVSTIYSTDPDESDTASYSLVSGNGSSGNGYFTISANHLTVAADIDYETTTTIPVRIRCTDLGLLSTEETFIFTVVNVNEAPTNVTLIGMSVPENSSIGYVVGTFNCEDPDALDSVTYTLVSGSGSTHNSKFTISGNQLLVNALIDYEVLAELTIRVRATDRGNLYFEKQFPITVINQADGIDIMLSNLSFNDDIAQNSVVSTIYTVTEIFSSTTYTYTLISGAGNADNDKFVVSGNQLIIKDKPNFYIQDTYSIRLRTADEIGNIFDKSFNITVTKIYGGYITLSKNSFNRNELVQINTEQAMLDYDKITILLANIPILFTADKSNHMITATIPRNYVNLGRNINKKYVIHVISAGNKYTHDIHISGDNSPDPHQVGSKRVVVPALKQEGSRGPGLKQKLFY